MKTIEEILRDKILDITDEYKGQKREEGIQVYLGYPQGLIDELDSHVQLRLNKQKEEIINILDIEIEAWMQLHDEQDRSFTTNGFVEHMKNRLQDLDSQTKQDEGDSK